MQGTDAKSEKRAVKIVICDDDKSVRAILQKKIGRFCENNRIVCQIFGCDSGEDVLIEKPAPDILFLDIQMPGRNGMEIAEELRKRHKDMVLIFVTALPEYVYEAFDVGAFHYLVKPFGDDKLKEVLGRALRQYERQREIAMLRRTGYDRIGADKMKGAILIKRCGVSTKVLLEDIIYAEVFNRKVMLHTMGGDIEYYGKLTEMAEQAGEDFYRTHRAYLVNLKYVEKYNATTIWLEKGTALIAKKQYAGFVRQYMQYINRKRSR